MGPCRLVGKNAEEDARGVCGAQLPVGGRKEFPRMIAAGTSAHSDHARDMVYTLLAVAEGHAKDFKVKDVEKALPDRRISSKSSSRAERSMTSQRTLPQSYSRISADRWGEMNFVKRAPKKTQERWKK